MASPKIALAFHNSSLNADDHKKVETSGMLILASDFIQSGKVNRANKLIRVSKIAIPLFLAKTKSGGYIAVNPFSSSAMNLRVTQLPPLTEIKAFCREQKNLELNRLHNKIMQFDNLDLELTGIYTEKELPIIKI